MNRKKPFSKRSTSGSSGKPSGNKPSGYKKKNFGSSSKRNWKTEASLEPKEDDVLRLNRYIANSGMCSRREADVYIQAGSVSVNGKPVTEMGYKVKRSDEVRFDGALINPERKEYVLLNKPKGFSTSENSGAQKSVFTLVSNAAKSKLNVVGRLGTTDMGLLFFTNDSEMVQKLSDHKNPVRKLYQVELDRNISTDELEQIRNGVVTQDGFIKAEDIQFVQNGSKREVGLDIRSFKNGVVRKLFSHFGYKVLRLDCVMFAHFTKKDLPRGHWRILTKQEVINLKMMYS